MKRLSAAPLVFAIALAGCQCQQAVQTVKPSLDWVDQSLSFGNIAVGDTSDPRAVHLGAFTAATITLGVTIEGDDAGVFAFKPAAPASIPPRGTVNISVVFTPKAVLPYAATLVITTNDPNPINKVHKVPITGSGKSPSIAVMPDHLSFTAVACPPSASSPRCQDTETVTIQNTGLVNLRLGVVAIVADGANPVPANLSLANLVSTTLLVSGDMVAVSILWRPHGDTNVALSEVGDFKASLQIPSNDPLHPTIVVPLTAHSDPAPPPQACLSVLSVAQRQYTVPAGRMQPVVSLVTVPSAQWLDPIDPSTIHVRPGMKITLTSLRVSHDASTATPATVIGSSVLTNAALAGLTLNYSVPVAGTSTPGTFTFNAAVAPFANAAAVATAIGTSIPGVAASDDGAGHLKLKTTSTGAAQSLSVLATGTANALLGFSTSQTTIGLGSDGAATGVDAAAEQANPCTFDPLGSTLNRSWTVPTEPTDSGAGVAPTLDSGISAADGVIEIDAVGQYVIGFHVADSLQLTADQTLNIDAQPRDDLFAQVEWQSAVGTDVDLDLHLLADSGPGLSVPGALFCNQDCFWDNRTPTWFTGAGTTADEIPRLLRDDQGNAAGLPSHESVDLIAAPQPQSALGGSHFRVAVFYYAPLLSNGPSVTPKVTIRHLATSYGPFMPSQPLSGENQVWYAADIVFPDSNTTCAPTCATAPCDCPPIVTPTQTFATVTPPDLTLATYGMMGACN